MQNLGKKIVKFNGGLGNQMFQYAFALSLEDKFDTKVYMDMSWFEDVKTHTNVVARTFGLDVFNTKCQAASKEDLNKVIYPNFKSKFTKTIAKFFPDRFDVNFIREKNPYLVNKNLLKYPNYFYYEGYFQNEDYFKHLRKRLLEEFSLKEELDERNKEVLEKIKQTNSVSVHIRRGDYVTLETVKTVHGTCGKEYYENAIKYISKKVENPHFFFFSDDIEWVKAQMELDFPYTIVDFNKEKGYFDLELMRNCKHNITANSSFSWWGAWLNENPEKIVIAPKRWTLKKQSCKIVPSDWVKI